MANTAKPTTAVTPDDGSDIEWDTLTLGLGEAWNFERDGVLVGNYVGTTTREMDDTQHPGQTRISNVYQFSPRANPDETVFIWGSASLDQAFSDADMIRIGDLLKITYLGKEDFVDKATGQPRVVRRYKVQVAKSNFSPTS